MEDDSYLEEVSKGVILDAPIELPKTMPVSDFTKQVQEDRVADIAAAPGDTTTEEVTDGD